MSFVSTGGVSKISQLAIDADKDWQDKGISNIKELALGMLQGDILVHDGTRIIRLPADVMGLVLTSNGLLAIPSWQLGGTYFNRYFPVQIFLSKAVGLHSADHTISKPAPMVSSLTDEISQDLTPIMGMSKSVALLAADQTIPKSAPITSTYTTAVA